MRFSRDGWILTLGEGCCLECGYTKFEGKLINGNFTGRCYGCGAKYKFISIDNPYKDYFDSLRDQVQRPAFNPDIDWGTTVSPQREYYTPTAASDTVIRNIEYLTSANSSYYVVGSTTT